jgi:hypothetical protein
MAAGLVGRGGAEFTGGAAAITGFLTAVWQEEENRVRAASSGVHQ